MRNLIMQLASFVCLITALQVNAAQTVRYQHTDMLGTPVMETDGAGKVISRSVYEPFGKRLGGEKAGIGYTGHLQDTDLGLTYMQARYYDPLIGRFYSNDPVGFKNVHNFNRYAYANNNPYKYIDPDGQDAYLVSRPLSFTSKANHNFIVYNAASVGDPNATVRSFGDTGNDTMGEVNADTKGFSEGTLQGDTDAWQSLSSEGSGVTFRKIDATDAAVAKISDSLQGGQEYSALPEVQGGVNSNTAAGAIANKADGGYTFVNNATSQPGSTVTERVVFKEEN